MVEMIHQGVVNRFQRVTCKGVVELSHCRVEVLLRENLHSCLGFFHLYPRVATDLAVGVNRKLLDDVVVEQESLSTSDDEPRLLVISKTNLHKR